jgi:uncharacterized SAM-binding protein YcdF (DUF218 family)
VGAAALVLVFLLRVPTLRGFANYLIVDDPPTPVDVAMVLNGSDEPRALVTAQLHTQGLAPRVVLGQTRQPPSVRMGLRPSSSDIAVALLGASGVPADSITVLAEVTSTFEEARELRRYLDARPQVRRVAVVTSQLHTRRTRSVFREALEGWSGTLTIVGAPHWDFEVREWWRSEQGLVAVNNEYVKLLYYLVMH